MLFAAKTVLLGRSRNYDVAAFSWAFVWRVWTWAAWGACEMYPQNLLLGILDDLFWPNTPHVVILDPFLTVPTSTPLGKLFSVSYTQWLLLFLVWFHHECVSRLCFRTLGQTRTKKRRVCMHFPARACAGQNRCVTLVFWVPIIFNGSFPNSNGRNRAEC